MSIMDELKKLTRPYGDDGTLIDDEDLDLDMGASEPVYTRPANVQPQTPVAPVTPVAPMEPAVSMGGVGGVGAVSNMGADPARASAPITMGIGVSDNVKYRVVMAKPEEYVSVTEIAKNICEGNVVIVNCEDTDDKVARRVIDFLSGCIFALNGSIKKAANNVFIIAPKDVGVDEAKEEASGS